MREAHRSAIPPLRSEDPRVYPASTDAPYLAHPRIAPSERACRTALLLLVLQPCERSNMWLYRAVPRSS